MSFCVVFRATKPLPQFRMEAGDYLLWDTSLSEQFQVVRPIRPDMGSVGMAEANGLLVVVSHEIRGRTLHLIPESESDLPSRLLGQSQPAG